MYIYLDVCLGNFDRNITYISLVSFFFRRSMGFVCQYEKDIILVFKIMRFHENYQFFICLAGSSRGKKSGKQCKKCGFNRPGSETYRNNLRRSLSEESLGGQMDRGAPSRSQDPYSYMRKRRVVYPKPVFYDEQVNYFRF